MFFLKRLLLRSKKGPKNDPNHYMSISSNDLVSLSNEELFSAVLKRVESNSGNYQHIIDFVNSLSGADRVFYLTSYYEVEVLNGGLCQFFVNSSREIAPELAQCLAAIGAEDHKNLFESFVRDNTIDVCDLSSFIINDGDDDIRGFKIQRNRYPFDEFDNAFFELRPIQDYLADYIRAHISEF